MDIKSNRKNRIIGTLVILVLIAAISTGIVAAYPLITKNAEGWKAAHEKLYTKDKLQSELYSYSTMSGKLLSIGYSLYWKTIQNESNQLLTPVSLFVPEYLTDKQSSEEANELDKFNELVEEWYKSLSQLTEDYDMEYLAVNTVTGSKSTNTSRDLEASGSANDFQLVFEYDSTGKLTIPLISGGSNVNYSDIKNGLIKEDLNRTTFVNNLQTDFWNIYNSEIKGPENFRITYLIPAEQVGNAFHTNADESFNNYYRDLRAVGYGGLFFASMLSGFLVLLLAIFLPFKKSFDIQNNLLARIPLELAGLGFILAVTMSFDPMCELATQSNVKILASSSTAWELSVQTKLAIMYGVNWICWFGILLLLYVFFAKIRQLFALGFRRFWNEQVLVGRFFHWILMKWKNLFHSLEEIDLNSPIQKTIFKIVGINFIILAVITLFWFFGIFALLIYSVALFFYMKSFGDRLSKDYRVLLKATNTMAQGNLNMEITESVGVFEPLKKELQQVQTGFKKAVDAETKSQQMKTELITNVSHDLKTPLTAIITYVNLLKEENITEEDRTSYIDTLDKKSQRLKHLIEDLFEVSKANSHNVTLHPVDVELGSLIRQVALELEDRINGSQIEFRYSMPEEKVALKLDSEKTFRIIENLLVNITKYAMSGSRAYIELKKTANYVMVQFKNTSAEELDFEGADITERFARGDRSRSTEGSGLGLAIAKSFTELQNGSFEITTDGDLFKAIVTFPLLGSEE